MRRGSGLKRRSQSPPNSAVDDVKKPDLRVWFFYGYIPVTSAS
jgi:hypothetical protein